MSSRRPRIVFSRPVHVEYLFIVPDKRKRDLDNMLKVVNDLLEWLQIFRDDSLVHEIHARKCGPEKPGSVIVNIEKLTVRNGAAK